MQLGHDRHRLAERITLGDEVAALHRVDRLLKKPERAVVEHDDEFERRPGLNLRLSTPARRGPTFVA